MTGGLDEAGLPSGTHAASADPALSIIIVVYKTPEYLQRCLDSIAGSGLRLTWEVLVLDNAPGAGECRRVAQGRPGVHYLGNAKNIGFGRACNQGMRLAKGRFYLILNPDIEVLPGSVEALVQCLLDEPDAGIAAPRLTYGDGTLQESCRTFYTLPIFLLRRTFLGKLFPDSPVIRRHLLRDWDHASTREVDWCLGASLLVRAEAVRDVGMMDERFFMYFEDVDWCYRMHQRGWKVLYHPAARMIHHYQRASAGWKPGKGLLLHLGSTFRYYEKWSFLLYWLKLRSRRLRQAALFTVDLITVALSFVLAYAGRSMVRGILTKPLFAFDLYLRFFFFTLIVAMGSLVVFGLYRERLRPSLVENGLPVSRALGWTSMLMMASTFLFSVRMYSRVMVLLFFPLAVALVTGGRVLLLRAVDSARRRDLNVRRIGLLGPIAAVSEALERFERLGRVGVEPVSLAQGEGGDHLAWLRRIRGERLSEVVLFEDWSGDVRGMLTELRRSGVPVRLLPALREHLPAQGLYADFLGWPSLLISAPAGPARRSPGQRLADLLTVLVLGVAGLLPYAGAILWRLLLRRPVWERVSLRGSHGVALNLWRLAGARPESGFARTVLDWYPALRSVAAGRLGLVGVFPYTEEEAAVSDPDDRRRSLAALPGVFGPWTGGRLPQAGIPCWNRSYAARWSAAEDFRIFWRAVLGLREPDGGKS